MRCSSGMVPFAEELLHQLVFAFGYEFDEGFVGGFCVGWRAAGILPDLAAAVAVGLVEEGFHGDEIDDAVEALLVDDGSWTGTTWRPQLSCMHLDHAAGGRGGCRRLWDGRAG